METCRLWRARRGPGLRMVPLISAVIYYSSFKTQLKRDHHLQEVILDYMPLPPPHKSNRFCQCLFMKTVEESRWVWNTYDIDWTYVYLSSLVAQLVKNPPAMWETWVQSLGWEEPPEKGMATHSSILALRIPQTVQSMGSQRVGHDWAIFTSLHFPQQRHRALWAKVTLNWNVLDSWVHYQICGNQGSQLKCPLN